MRSVFISLCAASLFYVCSARQWVQFKTSFGKNVDFDGGARNGARLQQWEGDANNPNQQFYFENGLVYGQNGIAVDVTNWDDRPGQVLQGYQGNPSQWNQQWEVLDNKMFRLKGSNLCWDVQNGNPENGASIQLHWCSFGNPNQEFQIINVGGRSRSNSPQQQQGGGSSSFCGFSMISWDQFKSLHPVIGAQAWTGAFVDAGNQYNIPPQLLAAIALQESSGNPNVNEAGLMQFTWPATFISFSNGKDLSARTNPWDAIYAAANYLRATLNDNGNDLNAALREYNGPLPPQGGGVASYQDDIRSWLAGNYNYGQGV